MYVSVNGESSVEELRKITTVTRCKPIYENKLTYKYDITWLRESISPTTILLLRKYNDWMKQYPANIYDTKRRS